MAALGLVPYLFLAPWVKMNWEVRGRFIPVEHKEAQKNIVAGALGLVPGIYGDWRALPEVPPDPEAFGSAVSWAFREVLRTPFRYLRSCVERLIFAVREHPLRYLAGSAALLGLRRRPEASVMGVLAAYFVGIHCLMAVVPAYFIPILPLLVVSSAAWAARVLTEGRPEAEPWAGRLAATLMGVVFVPCLAFSGYGVRRMQVYSREGSRDPSVAEANLLRESAVFPEDGWLLVESAKVRLRAGDRRAAVEALSKAVRLRPADRRARSLLGWALMLEGEPGLLLALEPEDRPVPPEIEVLKALVLIERGETSRARGMWEAARARWMQDSGLWREGMPEES